MNIGCACSLDGSGGCACGCGCPDGAPCAGALARGWAGCPCCLPLDGQGPGTGLSGSAVLPAPSCLQAREASCSASTSTLRSGSGGAPGDGVEWRADLLEQAPAGGACTAAGQHGRGLGHCTARAAACARRAGWRPQCEHGGLWRLAGLCTGDAPALARSSRSTPALVGALPHLLGWQAPQSSHAWLGAAGVPAPAGGLAGCTAGGQAIAGALASSCLPAGRGRASAHRAAESSRFPAPRWPGQRAPVPRGAERARRLRTGGRKPRERHKGGVTSRAPRPSGRLRRVCRPAAALRMGSGRGGASAAPHRARIGHTGKGEAGKARPSNCGQRPGPTTGGLPPLALPVHCGGA